MKYCSYCKLKILDYNDTIEYEDENRNVDDRYEILLDEILKLFEKRIDRMIQDTISSPDNSLAITSVEERRTLRKIKEEMLK